MERKKRQVAHKVWIKDLYASKYIKQEGWEPSYVQVGNKQVSRINILVTIVSKFSSEDGNYCAITLDDGTETIRVKAFGPDVQKIANTRVGKIVQLIGRVREYNSEVYIAPEAIQEVTDPNWIIVRKLELGMPISGETKPEEVAPAITEEEATKTIIHEDNSMQKKILDLIALYDEGSGADMQQVITNSELSEDEAQNIIVGLLKAGDVYEPTKGKLKAL